MFIIFLRFRDNYPVPTYKTMENSDLTAAIRDQDIGAVKRLLESGQCDVNGNSAEVERPIIECIYSTELGDVDNKETTVLCEILKLLVQHGADVNMRASASHQQGETAVMAAAQLGFLECLRFLTRVGADLSVTSRLGETALTLAAKEGRADCVKLLCENVSVSVLNHRNDKGEPALVLAILNGEEKGFQCLQHLIAAGAEVNLENRDGCTALMLAFEHRCAEAVTLLMREGALVNTVSDSGTTPFSLVLKRFDCMSILRLLRCGLEPALSCRDRSCLHTMAARDLQAVVRALVMSGFPPLDLDYGSLIESNVPRGSLYRLLNNCKPTSITMSPLAVAILNLQSDVAKYLVANRFFTRSDIVWLCWDQRIRQILQNTIQNGCNFPSAMRCLEIVDFLSTKPASLLDMSLIAVSSALSQDLVRIPSCMLQDKSDWICRPTFREKVERLAIPSILKRALLHQTPSSSICCYSWSDIPLGEAVCFPPCQCKYCEIDGFGDGNVDK